jgi:hypothetical protein
MKDSMNDKYVLPSPTGAFYSVSGSTAEPAKRFLQNLMTESKTSRLGDKQSGDNDQLLQHIKKLKWLQGFDQAIRIPEGTIEDTLPKILQKLSSESKALLADDQGLYLSCTGFTHEAAEELSALSGDLSSLYARHQGITRGNLNIQSSAFSLVDAAGYSQLGFWPLYIGNTMFVLVILGAPRFDQAAFVELVWMLHKRYYVDEMSIDSDAA